MRFTAITLAICLIASVQAVPVSQAGTADGAAGKPAGVAGVAGANPVTNQLPVAGIATSAKGVPLAGAALKRGLLDGGLIQSNCPDKCENGPNHPEYPPHHGHPEMPEQPEIPEQPEMPEHPHPSRPEHPSRPKPPHGGCPSRGCPTGPKKPTDCVGIIQSLLRELYPTLDFTAEQLDKIVAEVLATLGLGSLSKSNLDGRVGLLNDLLRLLGCTIQQLVGVLEQVVKGVLQ